MKISYIGMRLFIDIKYNVCILYLVFNVMHFDCTYTVLEQIYFIVGDNSVTLRRTWVANSVWKVHCIWYLIFLLFMVRLIYYNNSHKRNKNQSKFFELTSEAACQLDFLQVWQVRLILESQQFSAEPQRGQKSYEMLSFCSIVISIVINLCSFQPVGCK